MHHQQYVLGRLLQDLVAAALLDERSYLQRVASLQPYQLEELRAGLSWPQTLKSCFAAADWLLFRV